MEKAIIVRIDAKLHEKAMIRRAKTGLSLSRVLREALMAWVKSDDPRSFKVDIKNQSSS